jgi:hypothetical protein
MGMMNSERARQREKIRSAEIIEATQVLREQQKGTNKKPKRGTKFKNQPIGTIAEHNGVLIEVAHFTSCSDCIVNEIHYFGRICFGESCKGKHRTDGKDVCYKAVRNGH